MIANIQELYEHEPYLTARILGYWSNAFSAAVSFVFFVYMLSARVDFEPPGTLREPTPSERKPEIVARGSFYYRRLSVALV